MADIRFGTGGWRAIIGDDFSKENIEKFGQGVADLILSESYSGKPVVIGYDRRFLSDDASRWLASVLCANGINVLLLKRSAPTPLIMHTVKKLCLDYGFEVTASHNPPSFNGIKLIIHEGRDADVAVTKRLEGFINSVSPSAVKVIDLENAQKLGLLTYIRNPFNDYIDDIMAKMDIAAIRNRGLRIAFDSMHGSGTYPLLVILFSARCTIDQIHQEKDAYFGFANPAPAFDTLNELCQKVVRGKYDLGIAFDGDGDRLGIIDPNGTYIDANSILLMLYWYLHEYKGWKGPVVRNNSTTHLLDIMAESFGEQCYEVPVGFKWVSAKIDETDAILGGESSGGLTVRGHIYGKDSIYAACLFVEMLSVTGLTPVEIIDTIHKSFGKTFYHELSLKFTQAQKELIISKIMTEHIVPDFSSYEIDRISYEDGCKVYFKDRSFVICRFSGTEPVVRFASEAWDDDTSLRYISLFRELLKSLGC